MIQDYVQYNPSKIIFGHGAEEKTAQEIKRLGGTRVLLRPASAGTGLIVGGGMRPVLEAAGIRDAVGKSLGSKNRLNVVKATLDALSKLRSAEEIAAIRA